MGEFMKYRIGIAVVASAIAFATPSAMAQFSKAEDAITYRESAMALIGSHFGRMAPVAKKEVPYDAEQIRANVQVLNMLATLPWAAFDNEAFKGGDSLDDVWSDASGFNAKRKDFETNLSKLTEAVEADDFNAFRVAFGNTGKSCKACHDAYREKK